MNYHTIQFILCALSFITYLIVQKTAGKRINFILIALAVFIFLGPMFLPRQLFGKWNAIQGLNNKVITTILLRPAEPDWKVNLTNKDFIISNPKEIDTIKQMLQKAEVYFPGHPTGTWKTKMVIICANRDSLEIEIRQTEDNGTGIYAPVNSWRKDAIGKYLERITSYTKPVYSDTSTTKF
jgi:hypothetical protein